jgi:hypothetical protein
MAPRKPSDYDSKRDGGRESYIPAGDHTLNDGLTTVNLIRPKWEEGPLVFRPFPARSYEDPENMLLPGRKSAEEDSYTEWVVKVWAALGIGMPDCPRQTFICWLAQDRAARATSPWNIIYNACKQAHDQGKFGNGRKWDSEWNKLMRGGKGKGPSISPPSAVRFVQGCVLVNGDKNYMERRDKPFGLGKDDLCVIQLKKSAGDAMMDMFNLRKDEFEGDESEDVNCGFVFGDPVGTFLPKKRVVKGGSFVQIFNPYKTRIVGHHSSWSGEIAETQGYEAAIHREFRLDGRVYQPDLDSEDVDFLFDHLQFWFPGEDINGNRVPGLLHIGPPEQQMLWIAQAFRSVPKLIIWALGDHDELLTDEVRGIFQQRVVMVVPEKGYAGNREDDDDEDGDDDEEERDASRRLPVRKDPVLRGSSSRSVVKDDEDEDEDEVDEFGRASGSLANVRRGSATSLRDDDEEEEEEDEDEDGAENREEDEDEEEEEEEDKDEEEDDEEEDKDEDEEEEDEDEEEDKDEDEDEDEDEEEEDEDEEDEDEGRPAASRSKKGLLDFMDADEDLSTSKGAGKKKHPAPKFGKTGAPSVEEAASRSAKRSMPEKAPPRPPAGGVSKRREK